MTERRRKEK